MSTESANAVGIAVAVAVTVWFTVVARRRNKSGTARGVFSPRYVGGAGAALFIGSGVLTSIFVFYVVGAGTR
jgi:hypothetical protein